MKNPMLQRVLSGCLAAGVLLLPVQAIETPQPAEDTGEVQEILAAEDVQALPAGKNVEAVWLINGKEVVRKTFVSGEPVPALTYAFSYTAGMAETAKVGFRLEYVNLDGVREVAAAPEIGLQLEVYNEKQLYEDVLKKVTSRYQGNYTTKWAQEHDYTAAEKEAFVNAKGYRSSSKYLLWANFGTQHMNIFEGGQGRWKLVMSGLIASGKASTPTPVGVWKTTYKQVGWFTPAYTVKPVVRFKGGGYAMHSRLYRPKSDRLSDPSMGFPVSHGCIRMMERELQWIYDNVPSGTTLVVF